MSDNKKYYYLKLTDDFFDSDKMIILESMQDGYIYSNILLKLYLRSLKNDGKLMFNNRIPFNSTMLAQVTRHSVGDIEKAMKIFQDVGLVDIMDTGAIYMLDIQNFIGKSSTEADRIRAYRNKIQAEKNGQLGIGKGVQMNDKSTPEIEREKEIEIEIEREQKSTNVQLANIFKIYEQEIGMVTPILSDDIEFYLNELKEEIIIKAISEASTRNIKNWKYIKAILDRCIKENIKTLPDYEAKSKKKDVRQTEYEYEAKEIDLDALSRGYS